MAKIHILEVNRPGQGNIGTVRCIYHVNIESVKNVTLDVTNQVAFTAKANHEHIKGGGTATLGVSNVPSLLGDHPDFVDGEATLLTNQDIAEVEILVYYKLEDPPGVVGTRTDALYTPVENKAKSEYELRFGFYGTTRNPS